MHPLDRPVWFSFDTHWSGVAQGDGDARRLPPELGPFGAMRNASQRSMAALSTLVPEAGELWMVESEMCESPRGIAASRSVILQLEAARVEPLATDADVDAAPLAETDAPAMLALARLTRPGPFGTRTHELSRFIGVKSADGALVAMAGERMRPPGHAEVSGVCVHPDHRRHGLARALIQLVAARILARGERPFLHCSPLNAEAIGLYAALGFVPRRKMVKTVLTRLQR